MSTQESYSNLIQTLIGQKSAIEHRLQNIYVSRLITGLAMLSVVVVGIAFGRIWLSALIPSMTVFVYFVYRHSKEKRQEIITNTKLKLNENELSQLKGTATAFDFEPGIEYKDHIYANDLDIFGRFSLFVTINRTTTLLGKSIITNNLLDPIKNPEQIKVRQELVNELAPDLSWRQHFFAISSLTKEMKEDISDLEKWNSQTQFFNKRRGWIVVATTTTLCSFLSILQINLSDQPLYALLITVFALNFLLYQFIKSDATMYFRYFLSLNPLFAKWRALSQLVDERSLISEGGADLKAQLKGATGAFKSISNLNGLLSIRQNGMSFFIVNGFFLFDIWYIQQIEKWRKQNGDGLLKWVEAIGKMDAAISFANYKFNHPDFCNAQIVDNSNRITAGKLGHPLLAQNRVVRNDFEIGGDSLAHIITGSNMSGKSTFLRAVGLNLVLALNGLPVCAESFSCPSLFLASCIRINDSLESNESYFKAELNKLARIKALLDSGPPFIILLDEILRGTNSNDKNAGTRLFYLKIRDFKCLALLATHDVEIGQLANEFPKFFQNFHFESFINGADISFDYLLKPGVSTTKNATALMRNMGLID